MRYDNVCEVVREIERFMERFKEYDTLCTDKNNIDYTKESSALRRSSMDLTRALAKMRNGK
jgi:hypothetical protein